VLEPSETVIVVVPAEAPETVKVGDEPVMLTTPVGFATAVKGPPKPDSLAVSVNDKPLVPAEFIFSAVFGEIVKVPVVTVIPTFFDWPWLSSTLAVHDPAASPFTVKNALDEASPEGWEVCVKLAMLLQPDVVNVPV
jgi:hypothetical protein